MRAHSAALLLLSDGRLPAGGYAHSGGLEPAVRDGRVRDVAGLEAFVASRARTAGLVAAAFAAAACHAAARGDAGRLAALDAAYEVRTPSPAQRATSRRLGRQLVRTMRAVAPGTAGTSLAGLLGDVPHQATAMGAACAAFGLSPEDAALVTLHETAAGPVAAAVRLMSVDPFATHAVLARVGPLLDRLAGRAAGFADRPPEDLPACAAPLLDVAAERHDVSAGRLFAS